MKLTGLSKTLFKSQLPKVCQTRKLIINEAVNSFIKKSPVSIPTNKFRYKFFRFAQGFTPVFFITGIVGIFTGPTSLVTTGFLRGSILHGFSKRFHNIAAENSKHLVKDLIQKGINKEEELVYGVKKYLWKKGGTVLSKLYTILAPNKVRDLANLKEVTEIPGIINSIWKYFGKINVRK